MALPAVTTQTRQALPRRKGFLGRATSALDLPGNVVQNLLSGNLGGVFRNLADIGFHGLTLGAPVWADLPTASRPEDEPDWGLLAEILTDPLTWLTFGGAGAVKTLGTTAAKQVAKGGVKAGLKSILAKKLTGQLTKQGTRYIDDLARTLATTMAKRSPPMATRLGEKGIRRLARRSILQDIAPQIAKGVIPQGMSEAMLKQGGIRLGVPFMPSLQKTIAMKGKDPLAAFWRAHPARHLLGTGPGKAVTGAVGRGLDALKGPLRRASPVAQDVATKATNVRRLREAQASEWIKSTFTGLDDAVRVDMTTAISGFDPRVAGDWTKKGLKAAKRAEKRGYTGILGQFQDFLATHKGTVDAVDSEAKLLLKYAQDPRLPQIRQAVKGYRGKMTELLRELKSKGLLKGSGIKPNEYVMLQMAPEIAEIINKGDAEGLRRISTVFLKQRKHRTLKEFMEHGFVPDLDLGRVTHRRLTGQAHLAARRQLYGQAITKLGQKPLGAAPDWRKIFRGKVKLTDKVMEDWMNAGAGAMAPRGALASTLAKYNLWFKGPVTAGLGPIPNVSFVTRNVVSGVFQGLTDEDIGLHGAKHLGHFAEGLVGKVAQKIGLPFKGTRTKRVLAALGGDMDAVKGLKIGPYTGEEYVALLKRDNVVRPTFTNVEMILDIPKKGGKLGGITQQISQGLRKRGYNYAERFAQWSEEIMRTNSHMALVEKGIDPAEAAKKVGGAFIDYSYTSAAERGLRDVIPFFKFTEENIPRMLEASLRTPAITQSFRAGLRGAAAEGPLPPWIEPRPHTVLSETPSTQSVAYQFGTPLEDLQKLGTGEGFQRTLEQGVAGSLHPLIKGVYEAVSGREPFMGRALDEPSRAPSWVPDSAIEAMGGKISTNRDGTKYRSIPTAWTAALNNLPGSRQSRILDKLLAKRAPIWTEALDQLTGVKVYDVDKDRELRRQIRDYLKEQARAGNIGMINRFFAFGETDPALTTIMKEFYKVGPRKKSR